MCFAHENLETKRSRLLNLITAIFLNEWYKLRDSRVYIWLAHAADSCAIGYYSDHFLAIFNRQRSAAVTL